MALYPANFHYAATWSGLSIRDPKLAIGTTLSDLVKGYDHMVVPVVLIDRYNHVVVLEVVNHQASGLQEVVAPHLTQGSDFRLVVRWL